MKLARLFSPVLVLILFTACSKNDDSGSTSNPPPGSWKVNFYWDEKDETTDFTGYSFVFNAGGTNTVTKSSSIKLKDDNPAQDDQLHFIKL